MSDLTNLFVRIYARLLRLYPPAFHAQYADEMRAVFALHLGDAARTGFVSLVVIVLHELLGLPLNIIREHLRKDRELMRWFSLRGDHDLRRARNITRVAGLVVALFINWSLIQIVQKPDYNLWSQSVPFVVILFITNLLLLISWRWERLGARLTLLGAVGVGLAVAYLMAVTASVQNIAISPFLVLFVALAWAFPYLLFGLLFLAFSRPTPSAVPA